MPDKENVNQEVRQEPPPAAPDSSQAQGHASQYDQDHGSEKSMLALNNAMPWVISLLFHIGLFMVMFSGT